MCSPVLALTAISTVVGAYGQIRSANDQASAIKAQGEANANIAEYNARISDQNAEINARAAKDATVRGANDAATMRENARKANARGRAVTGSSGLLTDTGTPLALDVQNTGMGELNALTVMNNAEREAYGFKISETSDKADAIGQRYQGKQGLAMAKYNSKITRQGGLLAAGSTLVTGAVDYGKAGGFAKMSSAKR